MHFTMQSLTQPSLFTEKKEEEMRALSLSLSLSCSLYVHPFYLQTQLLISNSYFTHLLQLPRFAINGNWGAGQHECKRCGWAYRQRERERWVHVYELCVCECVNVSICVSVCLYVCVPLMCDEDEHFVCDNAGTIRPRVTFQRASNRNSIQKLLVHFYNLTLCYTPSNTFFFLLLLETLLENSSCRRERKKIYHKKKDGTFLYFLQKKHYYS